MEYAQFGYCHGLPCLLRLTFRNSARWMIAGKAGRASRNAGNGHSSPYLSPGCMEVPSSRPRPFSSSCGLFSRARVGWRPKMPGIEPRALEDDTPPEPSGLRPSGLLCPPPGSHQSITIRRLGRRAPAEGSPPCFQPVQAHSEQSTNKKRCTWRGYLLGVQGFKPLQD